MWRFFNIDLYYNLLYYKFNIDIICYHLCIRFVCFKDLANVMDKSNEFGVIVFTFGSLVAMESLPKHILNAFKFVFSQLPQTVLWKYENDHMADKPQNVVLCKWLPQRAILRESIV